MLARGYGLMAAETDGSLRRRPSYHALRTVAEQLEGTTFKGPLSAPDGAYLYLFDCDGTDVVVGWSLRPGVTAELPAPPVRMVTRDGEEAAPPVGPRVELGPSPAYFQLD